MAKKKHSAGKLIALAAVTGAVAGCVSYFLRYKSFHKELEEDFHDFEGDDDFDGQLPHESECCCKTMAKEAKENALLMADKAEDTLEDAAEKAADKAEEIAETVADKAEDAAEAAVQMAQDATEALKEKATTIVEEDKE